MVDVMMRYIGLPLCAHDRLDGGRHETGARGNRERRGGGGGDRRTRDRIAWPWIDDHRGAITLLSAFLARPARSQVAVDLLRSRVTQRSGLVSR